MMVKLYNRKLHRYVERQIHFGIGDGVKTACGLNLFSRHIMVSVFGDWDGAVITDDMLKITCKRCLAAKEVRLRKLIAIEQVSPGIFDRNTICGEDWLLEHALDVSKTVIDKQKIEVNNGKNNIVLTNSIKSKDRKYLLKNMTR